MPFFQPDKLPSLMVAPNGARKVKKDHPEVPLTIKETVEVAKNCFDAGAKAIHLHVRNDKGEHVLDAGLYLYLLLEPPYSEMEVFSYYELIELLHLLNENELLL